ncbi:D-sedoheptulose-7-phosphate isomerase [Brachyspira pilosicoli]|uniref:SIS domain-containing protein n=1 Tax=Brachyspira pilosicoli TaxID=52584 RepID=A0A5C8EUU4_BRAPL|nr:SIS domain-containing protein [Brachyspira pilosicoli]TXJ41586.1 SIS domain-containing protein [Brachyspira pilosicoli]
MANLIERFKELEPIKSNIDLAIESIINCYKNGNKVLIAGNGGSACDSEHIAGELLKSFVKKRPIKEEIRKELLSMEDGEYIADNLEAPLRAIALTSHMGLSTAYLNDRAPYLIFAQQLLAFGDSGDIFIAISTSGNAKNIIHASKVAKAMGIKIISFTNNNGGKLAEMADIAIKAPAKETYIAQEYHEAIYHEICIRVEEYFFKEDR